MWCFEAHGFSDAAGVSVMTAMPNVVCYTPVHAAFISFALLTLGAAFSIAALHVSQIMLIDQPKDKAASASS